MVWSENSRTCPGRHAAGTSLRIWHHWSSCSVGRLGDGLHSVAFGVLRGFHGALVSRVDMNVFRGRHLESHSFLEEFMPTDCSWLAVLVLGYFLAFIARLSSQTCDKSSCDAEVGYLFSLLKNSACCMLHAATSRRAGRVAEKSTRIAADLDDLLTGQLSENG